MLENIRMCLDMFICIYRTGFLVGSDRLLDRFIVVLLHLDRFGYIWIHSDIFLIVLNLSVPSVKIFLG